MCLQLTPQRPKRPDSRPNSAHLKHYRSSLTSTASSSSLSVFSAADSTRSSTATLTNDTEEDEGEEEEEHNTNPHNSFTSDAEIEVNALPPPLPCKTVGGLPDGDNNDVAPMLPTKGSARRSASRMDPDTSVGHNNYFIHLL